MVCRHQFAMIYHLGLLVLSFATAQTPGYGPICRHTDNVQLTIVFSNDTLLYVNSEVETRNWLTSDTVDCRCTK